MSRRSDQRRAAAFALYQHDVTRRELDDVFDNDATTFTRALAYASSDYASDLDGVIERHAKGWTIDRIAPLEKAIMRVALLEMRSTRPSRPPRSSAAPTRRSSSTASSPPPCASSAPNPPSSLTARPREAKRR
jgi:N utilization substance protein B